MSVDVSVVVPTYDRPDTLPRTLAALMRQAIERDRYEIIVIDDGSPHPVDAIVSAMPGADGRVRVVRQANRGVAAARNHGARLARGWMLTFVDDDMIAPPALVGRHRQLLEAFDRALVQSYWEYEPQFAQDMAGAAFGRYRMRLEHVAGVSAIEGLPRAGEDVLQARVLSACSLSVRRQHFWDIGGFDESFPAAGAEDADLSLRARALGFRLLLDERVRLHNDDRRLGFEQYCERQRRGALTRVLLAHKHPTLAVPGSDTLQPALKRAAQGLLARSAFLRLLKGGIAALERLAPRSRLLGRLYTLVCGLYIFRGTREGHQRVSTLARSP